MDGAKNPHIEPVRTAAVQYKAFWPAVLISERASEKIQNCEILYGGFGRAFQKTVLSLLELARHRTPASNEVSVVEVMPEEDVPEGIKVSHIWSEGGLHIADLWTPVQPELFGVARKKRK